jgi:hypothetical protein
MFSDGTKKGGRGREKNTTAEMSEPDGYKTPFRIETTTEHNNRLQRIHHHWVKKWFNYENFRILFAFTQPWNDCIAENCIGPDDEKSDLLRLQLLTLNPSKPSLISLKKLLRGRKPKPSVMLGCRRKIKSKQKTSC